MVTCDDDANKRSEGSSQGGEKRCFDLFAALLLALGDDETRAARGKEEQERNMLMIHTITSAATNTFLLGRRKIDDDDHERKNQQNNASTNTFLRGKRKIEDVDHECKSQENTVSSSSWSLVEYKRRRVESDDEPIRAQPIREIKPSVRKGKGPVKQKEPVRREPGVTPGWVTKLMSKNKGEGDAKMIFEKVLTKTDLTPNQGRLLMPFIQMADRDFLTEAELKILKKHHKKKGDAKKKKGADDQKPKGVDVIMLNRNGDTKWNLNMRIWEMRSSFNYALCTGWNKLVRENDLQINQTITLWSFHSRDGTLYFAFDLPDTHAASLSSSMVLAEDPFVCEEANRRILPEIPRKSRYPQDCVQIQTSVVSSSLNLLERGFDLNRTPPPEEDTEMDPDDLEAVQETHDRWTSQESLTETTTMDYFGVGCN